jgi:spermidine synthase
MQPWRIIGSTETPEGVLELRQRGERSFLITIAGRVLMTSDAHRSEDALAHLACAPLAGRARPHLLLGGLGMGYTLRAALDALPGAAQVTVVDLNPIVVDWCRGPLAELTGKAIDDPRVEVVIADVAEVIRAAPPGSLDAIVLDLYEGPNEATSRESASLYGAAALERAWSALAPDGVLAIWSEDPDPAFERRLAAAGFGSRRHRAGKGGRAHIIYVGRRRASREKPAGGRRRQGIDR